MQESIEQAFSEVELAMLRSMIAQGVRKGDVIKVMPGYSGRKYGQYSTYYEKLRDKLEKEHEKGERVEGVMPITL